MPEIPPEELPFDIVFKKPTDTLKKTDEIKFTGDIVGQNGASLATDRNYRIKARLELLKTDGSGDVEKAGPWGEVNFMPVD